MVAPVEHTEQNLRTRVAACVFVPVREACALDVHAAIRVGLDREGALPGVDVSVFDVLLTTATAAPRPWVGVPAADFDDALRELERAHAHAPCAAATLARLLRMTEASTFDDALYAESLAYSMLLGGEEFRAWRLAHSRRVGRADDPTRVELRRDGDRVSIRLQRPTRRNAFDARMRDALVEALEFTQLDTTVRSVVLTGAGPSFSAGGDLDEFGTATDLALAHEIRTTRSPARLVHAQRERVTARLHGACIGAGIEVPAAAARVVAAPDATFGLPEIGMGLIPGAGGTASIPRRIGRHRTMYWALRGCRLGALTAREWGLVDAVVAPLAGEES